jgi:hypothetical protein
MHGHTPAEYLANPVSPRNDQGAREIIINDLQLYTGYQSKLFQALADSPASTGLYDNDLLAGSASCQRQGSTIPGGALMVWGVLANQLNFDHFRFGPSQGEMIITQSKFNRIAQGGDFNHFNHRTSS